MAAAVAFAALAAACVGVGSGKTKIAVSIPPQKYFLEKITGDKVDVVCLLPNGADPETFEPSMSDLLNLDKCPAYLMMGNLDFEDALKGRIAENFPRTRIFDICSGLDAKDDPHLWCSVRNARVLAKNTLDAVASLDTANAEEYRENYYRLLSELDSLDKRIADKLEPLRGTAFVAWHPSLGYFASDYGLVQISLESENKEPSARLLQKAIDEAAAREAGILFIPAGTSMRQAETINKQMGLKIVVINVLDYDWEKQIERIADEIAGE